MRLVLAINKMRHKVRVLMDLQRATKKEAELKAAQEKNENKKGIHDTIE